MEDRLIFEIDKDDRLLDASASWNQFAASNEAPELLIQRIKGKSIYDFIEDIETREVQRMILGQARYSGRPLSYTIRCDSPTHMRLLQLVLTSPDHERVVTESTLLRIAPQDSGHLFSRRAQRSGDLLRVCSWCRRVWFRSDWLEPAEAVEAMGLFESKSVPQLTHGVCERCFEKAKALADD